MTVALFIGIVTIGHLIAYAIFVYWSTRLKASGNAADGEIIATAWPDGDTCMRATSCCRWWPVQPRSPAPGPG